MDFHYKNFAYNDTIKYARRQPEFEMVIHIRHADVKSMMNIFLREAIECALGSMVF